MDKREIPNTPHELPEPLVPQEIPSVPDSYEPMPLNSPEPEPLQPLEPNQK